MSEWGEWVKNMSPDTLAENGLTSSGDDEHLALVKLRPRPRESGQTITFMVPMRAFGKARPRLGKHGTHMPANYVRWCKSFVSMVPDDVLRLPVDQLVILRVLVVRAMPKGWSKKKRSEKYGTFTTAGADTDNAIGSIMDAIWKSGTGRPRKTDDVVVSEQCSAVWGQSHALIVTVELVSDEVRLFDLSLYGV